MKIYAVHHIPWHIFLCQVLSHLTISFVSEADAKLGHVGWAKSDSRTKQILQNIRSHIAQQEELLQQKECDPSVAPCKPAKIPDEDESVERATPAPDAIPPFRFRARTKTTAQLKKDVAHAMALKEQKFPAKKRQKEEEKDSAESKRDTKKVKQDDDKEDDIPRKKAKIEAKPAKKVKDDGKEDNVPRKKAQTEAKPAKKVKDDDEDEIPSKKAKIEAKPAKKVKDEEEEPKKRPQRATPKEEKKVREEQPKIKQVKPVKPALPPEEKKPAKPLKKPASEPEPKKDKKIFRRSEQIEVTHEKPKRKPKADATFPEDVPVFSLNSDSVKSEKCREHSRVYLRQLKRYKLWALMMYDATAKLPSGILQGNTNQYGDFDQCISINATFRKPNRDGVSGIEGKYCLATVDVSSDVPDAGLQHAILRSRSFDFIKSKISDPGHFIPRFSTINWGLCIPSVCRAEDVENSIKSSLGAYKKSSGLTFDVKVEDRNCVTKKDLLSDYDLKTYVTLLFYSVVIGVAVYATLRDAAPKKSKSDVGRLRSGTGSEGVEGDVACESNSNCRDEGANQSARHGKVKALVMAFSLKRSIAKLFVEGESEDNINCIHGIKSIFTVMLYFAHKTIPLALTPFSNRVVLTEISNEPSSILLRGSIIYTDSFLLLSGVLVSFNLSKEIRKNGRILWIRRIIARYIRLTPAMLATLLFYAYVSDHLGSGPMWNVVVSENSRLCSQHMWRNLLYIQNFYPFEEMCAPQTHQLALDMQLFLLSPLLVYVLYEYDKVGVGILQALLMVSSILRFTYTANNELSLFIFHGMPISQLYDTANLVYSQAVHRATPYIIGVLIGYYLQKVGKDFKIPNVLVILGWVLSSCLALSSLVTQTHLTKQDYEYSASEAAQYAALSPIAWSVAIGWFISACYLGYGGKLNEFLCSHGFVVFSRITYSVYLAQFLVFSQVVGTKRTPEVFSVYNSINFTEMIVIVVISIAMTLLFDIPTVEIKKIILDSFPSKKERHSAVAEESNKNGSEEGDVNHSKAEPKTEPDVHLMEETNEKEAEFKSGDLERSLVEKLESYQREDEEGYEAEDEPGDGAYNQSDEEGQGAEDEEYEDEEEYEGEEEPEDEGEVEDKERETANEVEDEEDFWGDLAANERY